MRNVYNCNNCNNEVCSYEDKKYDEDFPIDSDKGCFEHSHFIEEQNDFLAKLHGGQ